MLVLLLRESSGLPKFWWLQFPNSDKIVHVVMFSVGSLLLIFGMAWAKGKAILIAVTCWAIPVALFTEYYQHCCVASRSGELSDLLADVVGATMPLLLFRLSKP